MKKGEADLLKEMLKGGRIQQVRLSNQSYRLELTVPGKLPKSIKTAERSVRSLVERRYLTAEPVGSPANKYDHMVFNLTDLGRDAILTAVERGEA